MITGIRPDSAMIYCGFCNESFETHYEVATHQFSEHYEEWSSCIFIGEKNRAEAIQTYFAWYNEYQLPNTKERTQK